MAIKNVVLRGFDNGTVTTTIGQVVTRGYTIGSAPPPPPSEGKTLVRNIIHDIISGIVRPIIALSAIIAPAWILASSLWDDQGIWDDAETWND
jgi:hypothetical protein